MRAKKLTAVILAVVMIVAALPVSAFAGTTPGSWAVPEMNDANTKGLLTANAAKDFARALTRDEFCEIVVRMVEETLGSEMPLPATNPFTDCNSEYVQKAYQYGIVNGKSATLFAPTDKVLRQEIAAMMYRAMTGLEKSLGKTLLSAPVSTLTFRDSSKIGDFALTPVKYAVSNGIFKGDDNNNFNPVNDIISEECVAVVIRSYNSMQEKIDATLTNSQLLDKTIANLKIGYALGDIQSAVSQNVVLPTTGSGGAVISWSSNNPSVVSASGQVFAANGASAILTATVTLGGASRTKSFTLTTTTLTGDQLRVQNAKTSLEIGFYNQNDTLDSVTGRIFLPATAMGLNVSWYSDRPATVALNGNVVVPNDNTVITVNLTASFSSGNSSATKVFTLQVRNPAYAASNISLHNIKIGMSLTEVTKALGNNRTSLTLASGEAWYFYYTEGTYNNFIAVGMRSNKVAGVYSMVNGWEEYLRNADTSKKISVTEANTSAGLKVLTYTDSYNSNRQYAALMYDTTSAIVSERSLNVTATESFVTMLINAYRYLYGNGTAGKSSLVNDAVLSNSARNHSNDMDTNNYFSATGRTGNSTYASRAQSAGSTANVIGGVIAYNAINPFDFLNAVISNSSDRSYILSTASGQIGVGYSGSYTGAYKTLLTLVFASSTQITSVTASLASSSATISSVTVPRNGYTDITLTFQPTSFSENFTVETPDSTKFTVSYLSTPTTNTRNYRIYGGNTDGSYTLTVRGADGRAMLYLTVVVGTAYARSLTISGPANFTAQSSTVDTYYQLTANVVKQSSTSAAPTVYWQSNTTGVKVDSNGRVTIPANYVGGISITAWSPSGANASTLATTAAKQTVTITVTSGTTDYATDVTISGTGVSGKQLTLKYNETAKLIATTTPTTVKYGTPQVWTSTKPHIVTVDNSGNLKAVGTGEAIIEVTVPSKDTKNPTKDYIVVTVEKAIVTVTAGNSVILPDKGTMSFVSLASNYNTLPSEAKQYITVTGWTTNNDGIVKVEGDSIVAVSEGSTTITGTISIADNPYYTTNTTTINLTVEVLPPTPPDPPDEP